MICTRTALKGTLEIGRFRIPYRVYGEGKDIVCLNGSQQSMAMWFSFLQHFKDTYRITLFDFPHQGKAEIIYGPSQVSFDEQIEILHNLIQKLGLVNPVISSASWGGVISLMFALRYPETFKKLILASIGMRANSHMKETIVQGVNMDTSDREHMAEVLLNSFGQNLPDKVKKQIVAQFKDMNEERLRAFGEHGMAVVMGNSLDELVPLPQVKSKVVIIYGENDKIIDYCDVQSLACQIPDCEIKKVSSVGHFLHLEDERVFEVYKEILAAAA